MTRLFLTLLFLLPTQVFAFTPTFVSPVTVDDHIAVTQMGTPYSFFADLQNFPHTYEVVIVEPTVVSVQILVPVMDGALPDRSGIIVKKEKRGVSEVVRMHYREALWAEVTDKSTGDTYLEGGSFEGELEPGTYLVEVSTGENLGKYVLQIQKGVLVESEKRGYFATLTDVAKIKNFFEKPVIAVFQSPSYYIPLMLLLLVGLFGYRTYKKKHA